MPQTFQYLYDDSRPGALSQWIPESSTYTFPPMTLYDDAGTVLTSVADIWLTLHDLSSTYEIVNDVEHLSIKASNPRSRLVSGVLTLTLSPTIAMVGDTTLLIETNAYERRRALIEYSFGSGGGKSDVITVDFVIRGIPRRPYVTP